MNKKGNNLLFEGVIHFILIGLLFALFFYSATLNVNSANVKQQILEKQLALLIDSADSGMTFSVFKNNRNGVINKIEVKEGRIFVYVDKLELSNGYPFFSKFKVELREDENKFYIEVWKNE